MKLMRKLIPALLLCSLGLAAQTKVNLNKQSSPPGSSGQILYNNNGVTDAEDPLISWNYINLINVGNATGTITGSAVRNPTFSSYGTLFVTFASIGGSPSGCTLQIVAYDSLSNSLNSGSTISVTAANGTTSYIVAPAIALPTAAKLSATFACSVYPTGSPTISVDFVPTTTSIGMWAQPATSSDTLSATYAGGSSCTTHACVAVNSTGYGAATVWIEGTYTGSTINFEMQRDGSTTWYPLGCSQDDGTKGATSVALPSNQTRAYSCGVYGTTQFRVRQSALSTGSPVVGITISAAPIEPYPNVQANIADGGDTTLGTTTDAADTHTDGTSITIMQVLKEISAKEQAPASRAVTNAGTFPVQMQGTGSSGSSTLPVCDKTIIKNAFATSGITELVAASGSTKVYVCGFAINSASTTAVTAKLISGTKTSTACDTSAADLSILVPLQAPSSVAPVGQNVAPPQNTIWSTPASSELCVNMSAAQTVNLQVWYAQF